MIPEFSDRENRAFLLFRFAVVRRGNDRDFFARFKVCFFGCLPRFSFYFTYGVSVRIRYVVRKGEFSVRRKGNAILSRSDRPAETHIASVFQSAFKINEIVEVALRDIRYGVKGIV